ncbi:MAG: cysteine--tRNA ligase [Phycisphaeraceae bacterium]
MNIRFYNTLGHQLQSFTPVEPGLVRMYHCGPTVYDFAHIGNFRAFVFADIIRRYFEFLGIKVEQVMNITDVGHMTEDQLADGAGQDKMELASERLRQAKKQGKADINNPDDPFAVAEFFTEAFLEDAKLLGMKVAAEYPQHMPRATDHVQAMIDLIKQLIVSGHAYAADDGAVYYDVTSFTGYGQLSGNTVEQLQAGAGGRVSDGEMAGKRHPSDFLLWKRDERHLMKWPSPWGEGYPGWHIECSAMAMGTLKTPTLDIHTGGEDNIFPHHECEIAQSTGATGKPFANYWLHVRHLMVEGEKMSKSKGNFYTIRDLLAKGADPTVLRYELLRTHYRSNMNFTLKGLEDSAKAVTRLRNFVKRGEAAGPSPTATKTMGDTAVEQAFAEALADDLNMSAALGAVFKWINATPEPTADDAAALRRIDSVLGVLKPATAPTDVPTEGPSDADVEQKVQQMNAARADRDFATSDRLRDELQEANIEVQITREGVKWHRKMRL